MVQYDWEKNKIILDTFCRDLNCKYSNSDLFNKEALRERLQINEHRILDFTSEKWQVISFERPDIVVYSAKKVIAIEHFEVDGSLMNRKGSKYKQKYNDNFFNKIVNSGKDFETEIDIKINYSQLLSNTIDILEKHYKKIDEYKKNIKKFIGEEIEIEIYFFIEFNVRHPSFLDASMKNPALPHRDLNFFEHIQGLSKLDGIIFNSVQATDYNNTNIVISLGKDSILKYCEDESLTILDEPLLFSYQYKGLIIKR